MHRQHRCAAKRTGSKAQLPQSASAAGKQVPCSLHVPAAVRMPRAACTVSASLDTTNVAPLARSCSESRVRRMASSLGSLDACASGLLRQLRQGNCTKSAARSNAITGAGPTAKGQQPLERPPTLQLSAQEAPLTCGLWPPTMLKMAVISKLLRSASASAAAPLASGPAASGAAASSFILISLVTMLEGAMAKP